MEQSKSRSSAFPYSWCNRYCKRSLQVTIDYSQATCLTYIYIYIYIYIWVEWSKKCGALFFSAVILRNVWNVWWNMVKSGYLDILKFLNILGLPIAWKTGVQFQVKLYQRVRKWYLMLPCLTLSIIRYRSKVKWGNPGKGAAPLPTSRCSSYWKGSFRVTDYGCQLYYIYIYIYIY